MLEFDLSLHRLSTVLGWSQVLLRFLCRYHRVQHSLRRRSMIQRSLRPQGRLARSTTPPATIGESAPRTQAGRVRIQPLPALAQFLRRLQISPSAPRLLSRPGPERVISSHQTIVLWACPVRLRFPSPPPFQVHGKRTGKYTGITVPHRTTLSSTMEAAGLSSVRAKRSGSYPRMR